MEPVLSNALYTVRRGNNVFMRGCEEGQIVRLQLQSTSTVLKGNLICSVSENGAFKIPADAVPGKYSALVSTGFIARKIGTEKLKFQNFQKS